jgi:hypothetical protein
MTFVIDKSGSNPTDVKYTSPNRSAANLAGVIALTPAFAGELVRALDTGQVYRAIALTAGSWVYTISSYTD